MPNFTFSQRKWKQTGAMLVIGLLVVILFLDWQNSAQVVESPLLLALLNTLFVGVIPLVAAYLAAKSYQSTGAVGFLWAGCGMLFFGLGNLYAGYLLLFANTPDPNVTVHNLSCLAAGLCQLAGAHFFMQYVIGTAKAIEHRTDYKLLYVAIFVLVSITAALAFVGRLPVFFDPASGPSALRGWVLGSATLLFAVTGILYLEIYATTRTEFAYWYSLALCLIAMGLSAVFMQRSVGSALGWAGRAAQFLGGVYFLAAYLQARWERVKTGPLSTLRVGWTLWPFLEKKVNERTSELSRLNAELQKEIAQHQVVQQELQHREELIRNLVNSIEDIVFTLDNQQRHTAVYGPWVEKNGLTPEYFLGKTPRELFGEAAAAHEAANQRALAGEYVIYEWETPGPQGALNYETSLSPLRGPAGEITGLVGIGRNITRRKLSEEALRESEARLKFSQRVAHVGNWTWDTLANQVTWSDEMFRIFGLDPHNFDGDLTKIIAQAIHPDDREKVNQSNTSVLSEHKSVPLEYRIVWSDQSVHTVWAEAGDAVLDERGNIVRLSGIVQDITERKRAEERVQKSLREKETLLRELYHRTKNNMAVIIALLGLQAETFEDARLKEAFAEAQHRIRSMALVHQKLYDAQDLSRLNLKEYIQDLVPMLIESYRILPTRIRFIPEMEDVFVLIDSAIPVGLILSELLSNTLKYAFPDNREGEIRIELLRTTGGEIHHWVADNGVGVAKNYDFRQDGHLGTQNIFMLGEGQLQGRVVFDTQHQGVACGLQFHDIYYHQRV